MMAAAAADAAAAAVAAALVGVVLAEALPVEAIGAVDALSTSTPRHRRKGRPMDTGECTSETRPSPS
jgi:hypothetical protein